MSNDHQRKDVKHPLQSLISLIRCVSNGVTCILLKIYKVQVDWQLFFVFDKNRYLNPIQPVIS